MNGGVFIGLMVISVIVMIIGGFLNKKEGLITLLPKRFREYLL